MTRPCSFAENFTPFECPLLGHLRSKGKGEPSLMWLWLKWAMHSDFKSHLWLERGATCKTAEQSPPLETEISLLLSEAIRSAEDPAMQLALARQIHGHTPLGEASPSCGKVPGPCPGSWLQSTMKQHVGDRDVGRGGRKGAETGGLPCPLGPDFTLHAPLA